MNKREAESLRLRADIFKALGHPTRLWIVEFLAEGARCVAEIAAEVEGGLSAISQHLAMLRQYGIIRDERRGRQIYYSLSAPCVLEMCAILTGKQAKALSPLPKSRRLANGLSNGVLLTILVISLSFTALLLAAYPYVMRSRQPQARPLPPVDLREIYVRTKPEPKKSAPQKCCQCGLPMDSQHQEMQAQTAQ